MPNGLPMRTDRHDLFGCEASLSERSLNRLSIEINECVGRFCGTCELIFAARIQSEEFFFQARRKANAGASQYCWMALGVKAGKYCINSVQARA
jgi:hypothetical protein